MPRPLAVHAITTVARRKRASRHFRNRTAAKKRGQRPPDGASLAQRTEFVAPQWRAIFKGLKS